MDMIPDLVWEAGASGQYDVNKCTDPFGTELQWLCTTSHQSRTWHVSEKAAKDATNAHYEAQLAKAMGWAP